MERAADVAFRRLRERLLSGNARLDRVVCRAAFADEPMPDPLQALTTKIVHGAFRVTRADIDRARASGYSEDELFDLTVSAAVGSGLRRLAVVDGLLGESTKGAV